VPKRDEVAGSGEDYIMRNFMIFTQQKLSDKLKQNKTGT
jgi:hypothetical protein